MKRENDKTVDLDVASSGFENEIQEEQDLEDKWEEVNQKYLDIYEADLKASGISQKTFDFYMDYADTYINYFLLRYAEEEAGPDGFKEYTITDENRSVLENGCKQIGYYISYYYIYKDISATPSNLKRTVEGIKNFYKRMSEHEIVSKESYDDLCTEIEFFMDEWPAECKATC